MGLCCVNIFSELNITSEIPVIHPEGFSPKAQRGRGNKVAEEVAFLCSTYIIKKGKKLRILQKQQSQQ